MNEQVWRDINGRDDFRWGPGSWAHVPAIIGPEECAAVVAATAGARRLVMPHRTHEAFAVLMRDLAPLVQPALGLNVSGLGSDYFSESAGLPTHVDNDYVQALPGTFASVWLALADVTLDNGPLVIDGRAITCKMGDAIVIDGDTPHRSCAGRGPRPVALCTYIRPGSPFRPGNQQKREEVPL